MKTIKTNLFLILTLGSFAVMAAPRIGHHGDMIMKCHKPMFFNEVPSNNAKVSDFQKFSFNASENTDIATLKVWVNNQAIKVNSQKLPSGRYLISGQTAQPLLDDKVWVKVGSESDDGCKGLQTWNVYIE
jgi:hypothetical protein